MPIYLSPEVPGWSPRTEADLQAAIDGGLLEESHHLDLKKSLTATKSDNKELARDIASFAVDGGTLIIGLGEDKENRTFYLAPQPLKGLAEKVEQVARMVPDPPLAVVTTDIPSADDEEHGYLVVHIPASPAAPHMVDGRYHGRGDKTKHVLSDADVVRLHERRRSADQDALELLQEQIARDPLSEVGERSHLFLVAQPLAARRDMLLRFTSDPHWGQRLNELVERAHTPAVNDALHPHQVVPSLAVHASTNYRRTRGVAKATANIGPSREYAPSGAWGDEYAIELQVREDGGLRLYTSVFSDLPSNDADQEIFVAAAVVKTRRLLALIEAAAKEGGYFGNWAVAVGATRLKGRRAYVANSGFGFGPTARYDEDTYTETTTITWAELTTRPGAITLRLIGPLLRALGVEQHFKKPLTDPAPEQTEQPA
ncbi:AlbA family DNA-binding domain-containing protein [Streptomyces virginiae]|uniref:AlbA family DNA-binding domain-containing protein n=1 Tax=Streptomyces virginiae TaxID=1961 RepID=UPI0034220F03